MNYTNNVKNIHVKILMIIHMNIYMNILINI